MNRRTNQYVKRGVWVMKKRKDNISNQECPKCAPLCGRQPIGVGLSMSFDEILKRMSTGVN
jgi:hypothetical protein